MSNRDWCEEHGEDYNRMNGIYNTRLVQHVQHEQYMREERDKKAREHERNLEEIKEGVKPSN